MRMSVNARKGRAKAKKEEPRRGCTYRRLVRERCSSTHATWKCSRLVTICAICDSVEVPANRWPMVWLMWLIKSPSKDWGITQSGHRKVE
jgi:hypothetical protein